MKDFIHVAVIDDEVAMEILFQGFLDEKINSHNLKLSFFDSAVECLKFLEEKMPNPKEKVDIIFSDVNMPLMNGFEFLDEVRKKYPSLDIYIMSGMANDDYLKIAESKGAKGFYVKPFDFEEVIRIVDSFVLE